jgi:rhodanese-related sulfurtransferase
MRIFFPKLFLSYTQRIIVFFRVFFVFGQFDPALQFFPDHLFYPRMSKNSVDMTEQICRECSPGELKQILENRREGSGCIILDVRTPEEYYSGCIAQAENINFSDPDFREKLEKMDKARTYAIYCRHGIRASRVLRIMADLGFHEVYSLQGGIERWKEAGLPVEKPAGQD